ncbi:hypothetical protein JXA47_12575 [Candidatus Sumerlaeota bacterium]|nr:hypothetical protein [Candidatus Sumerlaeota bacterium]
MPNPKHSNPWGDFHAEHGDRRKKGGPFTILLLCLFFGLGGAALGGFLGTFGMERYGMDGSPGVGPDSGETIEEYNRRFFRRGKIGAAIGAVVGIGFVLGSLASMDD